MNLGKFNPLPGFSIYFCYDCMEIWKIKNWDCKGIRVASCPKCSQDSTPYSSEVHYEWPVNFEGELL